MQDFKLEAENKLNALKVGDDFTTQGKWYLVDKIYDGEIDVMILDERGQITFETDTLYKDLLLIDFIQDIEEDFVNEKMDTEKDMAAQYF